MMRERDSDHRRGKHSAAHAGRRHPGKPRHGEDKGGRSSPQRFAQSAHRRAPRHRDGPVVLYGWHTVKAALANPQRQFHRLLATENAARRLAEDGIAFPIEPALVRLDDIAAVAGPEAVHQGLYAEADPLPSPELEDVATGGVLLVLDQITDPHNVGAILRSAAAFAVRGVVTTERHSPEATGVLAKAASGALEYVPIVTVVNLARALAELHELNALLVGLDSAGDTDLAAAPLAPPLGLVIGAEGKGLRHLTRQHCDVMARLALPGRITSLNVSNATALALYVTTTKLGA